MSEFKELIYRQGFTVGTLAQRVGVTPSTISRIANHPGTNKRQSSTFFKIARALKTSESEIRRMTGNKLGRDHPLISVLSDRGMSIQEFADWSGVAYYTLIGIVSRRVAKPQDDTMQYIADMLEVEVNQIC